MPDWPQVRLLRRQAVALYGWVTEQTFDALRVTSNSLHTSDHGPMGTITTIVLDPDDADAADADTERWESATGARAFRVIPKGPSGALAAFEGIIFAWSTTNSDLAAVNSLMSTVDTGLTTPSSGGTEVANAGVLLPLKQADGTTGFVGNTGWIFWDGTTRIKTIAVRSSGADFTEGVVLQVVT